MVRSVAKELEEAKSAYALLYLPANPGFLVSSSVMNGKKNFSHLLYVHFHHWKEPSGWTGHIIPGCQAIMTKKGYR